MSQYKIESSASGTTIRKEYRETLSAAQAVATKRAGVKKHLGEFTSRIYERRASLPGFHGGWELIVTVTADHEFKAVPAEDRLSVRCAIAEIERLQEVVSLARLKAAGFRDASTLTHKSV